MNLLEKINKFLPLALVIVALIVFYFFMNKGTQATLTQNFELLNRNLAVSQSNQVENLTQLTTVLGNLTESSTLILERLESIGTEPMVVTHTTGGITGGSNTIYITGPSDIPDEFIFVTEDGMVVARYEVIEDEDGDAVFNTEVYDLGVEFDTVVAFSDEDESTVIVVVEGTVSSSYSDEVFPLDIIDSQTYYRPLDPNEFHLWDPHVDIGATAFYDFREQEFSAGVNLGFIPSSYGNDRDERFRFLRLGVTLNESGAQGNVSPVGYNLGSALPIVDDTWVYPTLGTNFIDQYTLGLTISSTF